MRRVLGLSEGTRVSESCGDAEADAEEVPSVSPTPPPHFGSRVGCHQYEDCLSLRPEKPLRPQGPGELTGMMRMTLIGYSASLASAAAPDLSCGRGRGQNCRLEPKGFPAPRACRTFPAALLCSPRQACCSLPGPQSLCGWGLRLLGVGDLLFHTAESFGGSEALNS